MSTHRRTDVKIRIFTLSRSLVANIRNGITDIDTSELEQLLPRFDSSWCHTAPLFLDAISDIEYNATESAEHECKKIDIGLDGSDDLHGELVSISKSCSYMEKLLQDELASFA